MSVKNAQGAVDERRLRPIYDLLENSNNKKAIQEADKVLKKQPSLLCAKALKALALLRLGKENESSELLESIRKEKPTDDATLQGMTMCYSELTRFDLICELYEAAKTAQPKNEDIIINLFSAYVRVGDYKKQKETALALYKVKPKSQYYFWASVSILLEALSLDELTEYCMPPLCEFKEPYVGSERSNDNKTLLCWVEKIVDKVINEDKIESPGGALLCLVVPEALGNYTKTLQILESLSSNIPINTVNKKKVDLLIKMEKWDKANVLLKKLLLEEPDSWVLIQYYLESVFRTMNDVVKDVYIDNTFDRAAKFINKLVDDNKDAKKRGPYLARLELYKRRLLDGKGGVEIGDYVAEVNKYVKEWGSLDCCTRDLAPYLTILPKVELTRVLNQIWCEVGLSNRAMPNSAHQTALHLTNLELAHASNLLPTLSQEETYSLIAYLTNCFLATQEMTRQSDRYILICVHYLFDAYQSTQSSSYIFQAIVLLLLGLNFNPNHRQFKLCLVKLYHCLGASVAAHEAFLELDIKHMQVDSLGYLHVWPTLASGNLSVAFDLLLTSLKFFNNNYKDSLGHVSYAYKYDTFTKIPEFIGIKDCLNNSFQYRLVRVEHTLMQIFRANSLNQVRKLLNEADSTSVFKDNDWANIYDNRDLNVFWNMDGEDKRLSKSEVEASLGRELVLLKVRCLVGRWIGAAVNTRWKEGGRESGEDTGYESGASEGSSGLEEVAKELGAVLFLGAPTVRSEMFSDPPPSRLDAMLSLRYFQPLLYQAHLVTVLLGDNPDSDKAQQYINLMYVYFHEYCDYIANLKRDTLSRAKLLTAASLFTEIVSLTAILVKVLESLLCPTAEKKNKKKRDQQEEPTTCWKDEMTSDLRQCVTVHVEEVVTVLRREQQHWKNKPVTCSLSSITLDEQLRLLANLQEHNSIIQGLFSEVSQNITFSHDKCISTIINVLSYVLNQLS